MASVLTVDELAQTRLPGHWKKYYLGIAKYNTVYTARVNQTFTSNDMVTQITYDGGSGTLANVKLDMTMYVGSSAGAYDLGMCRIRKTPTSTIFYIGEISNIQWADNLYLTIVDDFQLSAKPLKIIDDVAYMDVDVAYSDQHATFDPVPIMGGHRVLVLDESDPGEKITNGTFPTNTNGWTAGAGVLLTVVSGHLHINRNGAGVIDHAYQDITTVIGKTYILSVNIVAFSHQYQVRADGVQLFDYAQGTGVKKYSFVATSTTTRIAFRATNNSSATLDVDDVSVTQGTPIVLGPDANTAAYVLNSTIASKLWSVPAAAATLNNPTATNPTLILNSSNAGTTVPVYCTFTATAGSKTAFGVRYVFVYDSTHRPVLDFTHQNKNVNYDIGGYGFDVEIRSGATVSDIRDHALCLLFSEDYIDGDLVQRAEPFPSDQSIETTGYIGQYGITKNWERGSALFKVEGAHAWFKKMQGFPVGLELVVGAASVWTQMPALTVTRMIWHYLHWRTTATKVMDVFLPTDELYAKGFNSLQKFLWEQIVEIASPSIFAQPGVDIYGRFWLEIEPQMVPLADRTWPVVMDIESRDWQGDLKWDVETEKEIGILAMAGTAFNISGDVSTFFSLSPGHIPHQYGGDQVVHSNVPLVLDQADLNSKCGLYMGWKNNPNKRFEINFRSNFKAIDLWPRQFFHITIAPADDPRGVGYDGNLIPREINYEDDRENGYEYPIVGFEGESFEQPAITGDIPINTTDSFDFPSFPDLDFSEFVLMPPLILPIPGGAIPLPERWLAHDGRHGMLYTENFSDASPTWENVNWGLTGFSEGEVTYLADVRNMLVTNTGRVFIHTESEVYSAPSPKGTYVKILSTADLEAAFGTGSVIKAMGYNHNTSESIMLIIWRNATNLSGTMIGDSGGFVKGEPGYTFDDDTGILITKRIDQLHYGGGNWAYSFGCNFPGASQRHQIRRFSAAGVHSDTDPKNISSTEGVEAEGHIFRLGTSGTLLMWERSDNYFAILEDNANGAITEYVPPVNFRSTHPSLAATLDGQTIMAHFANGSNAAIRVSVDGGANWGSDLSMPVGFFGVGYIQCIDANRWIVACSADGVGDPLVLYTEDQGASWIDKSGNIATLFPSPDWATLDFLQAVP